MKTYKIIATGSTGNAYLIHEEILIDVGVGYKTLTPYLDNVKAILLTHIHGDHFKSDVISRIAMLYPDITFICGKWIEPNLQRLNVSNYIIADTDGEWIKLHDYLFYPIELFHGDRNGTVQNYGWRIIKGNHKTIHMTDTGSYDGIKATGYDVIAIEANHDRAYLDYVLDTSKQFEHGYYSRQYHASNDKALKFVNKNKNEDSEIYYLHGSNTYGGLV